MQDPRAYTIGWICALEFEYTAARALLDELHEPPTDLPQNHTNTYALGRIGEHNVVIATRQWSAHSLSTAVPDMLRTFCNIRALLSVGVGGGAPSAQHDVRLGDIVVSSPRNGENGVLLYDFGKTMESRPVLETGLLYPSLNLFQTAVWRLEATYKRDGYGPQAKIKEVLLRRPRLREGFSRPLDGGDRLYKSYYTHRSHGECDQLCGDDPSTLVIRPQRNEGQDYQALHYGRIAISNQILKDAEIRDKLAAEFEILCFDNEAGSLGSQLVYLVIRGICDYADSHKSKKWQRFAAVTAAVYAKDLLREISSERVRSTRTVSDYLDEVHNERNRAIERWLSPIDPSIAATEARKHRQVGFERPFMKSEPFIEWKRGSRQHLWLYGKPQIGKTVLCATVLDHLEQVEGHKTLYFFSKSVVDRNQKLQDVLCSLAFQLYCLQPNSRGFLDRLFAKSKLRRDEPDTDILFNCLRDMLQASGKVFILLDSLNECCESRKLLIWIENYICVLPQVQLMVFSRHQVHIERNLRRWLDEGSCISLDNDWTIDVARSFVRARLRESRDFTMWAASPDILEEITDVVSRQGKGIAWARLSLNALAKCHDHEELGDELRVTKSLPPIPGRSYARTLDKMPSDQRKKTIRLLRLLVKEQPLPVEKAAEAFAGPIDKENFDAGDWLRENRRYFASLVRWKQDKRTGECTLRLNHGTLREYLTCQRAGFFSDTSDSDSISSSNADELASVVSGVPSLTTGSTVSSIMTAELLEKVRSDVLAILQTDADMQSLLEETPKKIRAAKFTRNFLRLFRYLLSDIKTEVGSGNAEFLVAISVLKRQSRSISGYICQTIFESEPTSDAWAALAREIPDKSWQTRSYVANLDETRGSKEIPIEDGSSDSELSEPEDSTTTFSLAPEQLQEIFLRSHSFSTFRQKYRTFLLPLTDKENQADRPPAPKAPLARFQGLQRMISNSSIRLWKIFSHSPLLAVQINPNRLKSLKYENLRRTARQFLRPSLKDGYRRLEWTCDCGEDQYADFEESDHESLRDLQAILHCQSNEPEEADPALSGILPNRPTSSSQPSSRSQGRQASNHPQSTRTAPQNPSHTYTQRQQLDVISNDITDQSSGVPSKRFVELCVNTGEFHQQLAEIDVTDVKNDAQLFSRIRERYFELRSFRVKHFLLKPMDVHFVQFCLEDRHRIGILDKPFAVPNEQEMVSEGYAYHPCPMKSPPIPTNIFLHHLSHRSASIHRRLIWAKRMPQKLDRSILQGQSGDALVVGWGVHILEGLDRFTSLAVALVMLLLSGVVSIAWTVTQDDVQGGFGIGAWMTSVQAVVMMMVLAKWREL